MPLSPDAISKLMAIRDGEQREWSLFMGYRVRPPEIATLKVQLARLLEREGTRMQPKEWSPNETRRST